MSEVGDVFNVTRIHITYSDDIKLCCLKTFLYNLNNSLKNIVLILYWYLRILDFYFFLNNF